MWTQINPESLKHILLDNLLDFMACLPILILLVYSYLWAVKKDFKTISILLVIVFSCLGPALQLLIKNVLLSMFMKSDAREITSEAIKKFTTLEILPYLFLSSSFYITHIWLKFNQQKEATFKAESLAKDVQLKMLRYQINPHFLFNVLNSIHALIDENTVKAKKLLVEMSEYYRYTLNKQEQTISVEKEVEAITKYLEIQKTRFEEKFVFEIYVDEAAKELLIPSFVIHLLIENAVKYGMKSNEQNLQIRLSILLHNKTLVIKVANTGNLLQLNVPGDKKTEGTGNGIENIKNRLALFYNSNYAFSLTEENGWVTAIIEIQRLAV